MDLSLPWQPIISSRRLGWLNHWRTCSLMKRAVTGWSR